MSLQLGLQLKAKGQMKRESRDASFIAQLRAYAITYSQLHGFVHTDMLRAYAESHGLTPSHPNSWGCLFKGKHWRAIGRQRSTITSNHGRFINVYIYQP
jgi:hypothetical protein